MAAWLIPLILIALAAMGVGAFFLVRHLADKKDKIEKIRDEAEDIRSDMRDIREDIADEVKDGLEADFKDIDYRRLTHDDDDDYDFPEFDYDMVPDPATNPEAWYSSCTSGNYRLSVELLDNNDPTQKYRCHVDFVYTSPSTPITGARYFNDSYGGSFAVRTEFDGDDLEFKGREGGKNFEIEADWLGGDRFGIVSTYGTTVLYGHATLSRR